MTRRSVDVLCYITVDDHNGQPPYEAVGRLRADYTPERTLVWSAPLDGADDVVRHITQPPPYPVLDQLILGLIEQRDNGHAIAS